jgi:hypothetical protein
MMRAKCHDVLLALLASEVGCAVHVPSACPVDEGQPAAADGGGSVRRG